MLVECVDPWILAVSVIVGLLVALLILIAASIVRNNNTLFIYVILKFVLFSFVVQSTFLGHGYFKRKKNEELRKRWREVQETDGSLGARVIPPLGKCGYHMMCKVIVLFCDCRVLCPSF